MGIVVPRPAMRRGEERRLKAAIALHADIRREIREAGARDAEASKIAFYIVSTQQRRRKIWRAK